VGDLGYDLGDFARSIVAAIRIRDYRPGDEYGITTLFRVGDPRHERSVEYWRWSNSGSIYGNFLSSVAEYDDTIIGHYALVGFPLLVGKHRMHAAFGQQAVIHPRFRNLKVFMDLACEVFRRAKKVYDVLYAFPNDRMVELKTSLLGWTRVERFAASEVRVDALPAEIPRTLRVRRLDGYGEIPADWYDPAEGEIALAGGGAFLEWRLARHPIYHYVTLAVTEGGIQIGYMVLKLYREPDTGETIGHLIDYETVGGETRPLVGLLAAARGFFQFHGIQRLRFWNKKKPYQEFFNTLFPDHREAFESNLAVLPLVDQSKDILVRPDHWSFAMVHSDAF